MGTKLFSDELPVHKATVDTWIASLIQTKLGVSEWITPLGADGKVPSQYISTPPLVWGNISGTLSDQTDLLQALGAKASTDSPAFSGVPTAPKASVGTNTLQIASTSFVQEALGTIPASSINSEPIVLTADATFTADDILNKYYICNASTPIDINLPSVIGLGKQAINFIIQNKSDSTVILRDSGGSLLEAVPKDKFIAFSIYDNTIQNGVQSVLKLDVLPPSGFVTPALDIYKSGVLQSYGGAYGRNMQMIELSTTKWAIIFSLGDTNLDTYVQLFEWTGSAYNYGTAVEVTDTYNSAFIWKQSDTLLGCGLETGDGANYLRSLSISGLTITKNAVVAVQTSGASYQYDTTKGVRLSDTQSLLYYVDSSVGDPSVKVATVNGTSWTFGAEYTISLNGSLHGLYLVSPTEFIAFYYYTYMRIRRGTISGSTISFNAEDIIDLNGVSTNQTIPINQSDNYMFDRGDGTYCIALKEYVVNFSLTNGVYSEIGWLQYTGTSNQSIAMFKASNNRAVVICDDGTAGEENNLGCYVIDYSTATPTLIGYVPLDNIGNVHFTDTYKIEFTAGATSFSIDVWDENAGQYCNVEVSLGGIAI